MWASIELLSFHVQQKASRRRPKINTFNYYYYIFCPVICIFNGFLFRDNEPNVRGQTRQTISSGKERTMRHTDAPTEIVLCSCVQEISQYSSRLNTRGSYYDYTVYFFKIDENSMLLFSCLNAVRANGGHLRIVPSWTMIRWERCVKFVVLYDWCLREYILVRTVDNLHKNRF